MKKRSPKKTTLMLSDEEWFDILIGRLIRTLRTEGIPFTITNSDMEFGSKICGRRARSILKKIMIELAARFGPSPDSEDVGKWLSINPFIKSERTVAVK